MLLKKEKEIVRANKILAKSKNEEDKWWDDYSKDKIVKVVNLK